MDSRFKKLVKNRTSRIKDAGAHLYHASTGVTDGNVYSESRRHRLKKQLARYRTAKNPDGIDKMYLVDETTKGKKG